MQVQRIRNKQTLTAKVKGTDGNPIEIVAGADIIEARTTRLSYKAAMVPNLLVLLCGDRGTQPIVNAGSLYH